MSLGGMKKRREESIIEKREGIRAGKRQKRR
jgi:hypothetical protein